MSGSTLGLSESILRFGDKTKRYADIVYLIGLTLFLTSQACNYTRIVMPADNLIHYCGTVILVIVAIFRLLITLFRDMKTAIAAIGVLLLCYAYNIYSGENYYSLCHVAIALIGAIGVKGSNILITGIISNLIMIVNNIYWFNARPDLMSLYRYDYNDFSLFFGQDTFRFPVFNNFSSTDFAAHYFWIIIAYLWIRGKRITWGEIAAFCALDVLVYSLTGSNTTFVCVTLALIVCITTKLIQLFKMHSHNMFYFNSVFHSPLFSMFRRVLDFCAKYSFVLLALLMIILTIAYSIDSPLMTRMNQLLHWRLSLGNKAIINYGINLFATGVNMYGSGSTIAHYYNFVDCSYISILVRMGILPLVLYVGSMTAIQIKHKKELYGAVLLAVCAVSCVEEHHLPEIPYNFFILLLFADLDLENRLKVHKVNASTTLQMQKLISIGSCVLCCGFLTFVILINYPRYVVSKVCDRLDQKSAEIYTAIQSNTDELVESGEWQMKTTNMSSTQYGYVLNEPEDFKAVTGKNWIEATKNPKVHSYYSVSYDSIDSGSSYEILNLLITDDVKLLIGDGSVVIEYDVVTGELYSVWYSDNLGCQVIDNGRDSQRSGRLLLGTEGYATSGLND